ncbi:hypothetical protein OOK29_09695 [Streptomyces phaeochromogenes]|uniref:hypothetical protein n=1 Tax=Streptomyces phaeochromogenes TaxID=1923 RepID=UPI0022593AFD|nr:hypothetical protein [Streptomyces phaeochromogenes]MCX5598410.1 hypothetical protein [Streptomyces phaeochromogenes]
MAGKTWSPGNAKKFAKDAKLGKPYYYINDHARNLGGYEDAHTYSEIVFDYRRPFTGTPASGSMDAVQLCQNFGPVYDSPPKGLRNLDGPAPQVGSPLGDDYHGILDEVEIRGLGKRVGDTVKPHGRRI